MDDDDDLFAGLGDSRPAKNTTTNAKPNNSDFMSSLFGTGDFFKVAGKKNVHVHVSIVWKDTRKKYFFDLLSSSIPYFFGKCMLNGSIFASFYPLMKRPNCLKYVLHT